MATKISVGNKVNEGVAKNDFMNSLEKKQPKAMEEPLLKKSKKSFNEQAVTYSQKIAAAENTVFADVDSAIMLTNTVAGYADYALEKLRALLSMDALSISNPIALIIYLLGKFDISYEDIKKFLVEFLIYVLPEVEIGIKASLLANIKNAISCTADPRIPKKLRKRTGEYYFDKLYHSYKNNTESERGFLIDCDSIDPEGILAFSPYSEKGKNYYFGIDSQEDEDFFQTYTDGDYDDVQELNHIPPISMYTLCRADDKDAFLWFAMHKGRFPSPSKANFNGSLLSINGQMFMDSYMSGKSSIFNPLELNVMGNEGSKLGIGSAIVDSGCPNQISICISESDADGYVSDNKFIPVSSDWNSVDWYVDKSQYYAYNFKKSSSNVFKTLDEYGKQKAICNIQYLQPTDYSTEDIGGSTQKFRFTILPKPYVYLPYLGDGEPIWRRKRILFDANGEPAKNGCFSLPTDRMTSKNLPYVHNIFVSPFTEEYAVEKEVEKETFATDAISVINFIKEPKNYNGDVSMAKFMILRGFDDGKGKTVGPFNAAELHAMAILMKTDAKLSGDTKTISVINNCFNEQLSKEGRNPKDEENSQYVKMKVGEDEDNCSLYIDKKSGEYFLASSKDPSDKRGNYTKHLVRCYNGLTIFEFNYDFIMGMRLLSPKVVCAKLLEGATNSSSNVKIGINRTKDQNKYAYLGSQQSISEIVRKIVETEDTELSNCFFSFNNTEYADMLQEAEEKRYYQQPYLNDKGSTVDLSDVFKILNDYPETGTKEEQKTVIENAISAATAKISGNTNVYAKSDSSKLKLNFVTNMLSQLTSVVIESILTPKVLLLFAVNKQIMGDGKEAFNTSALLNAIKGVVVAMVKEIVELIIKKLLDYLLDYLGPLAVQLEALQLKEQYDVYFTIYKQLLEEYKTATQYAKLISDTAMSIWNKYFKHSSSNGSDYDLPTVLDNVNYADIVKTTNNNNDTPVLYNNC